MAGLPYIVGNWKMNGTRAMLSEARAVDRAAARFPKVQVGLAPPATLILIGATAGWPVGVTLGKAAWRGSTTTARPDSRRATRVARS